MSCAVIIIKRYGPISDEHMIALAICAVIIIAFIIWIAHRR